jgi:pilus assembly protein Flp/PilA
VSTRQHNEEINVITYLRIMIDARLATMDERGASAVEYGLLVAGIAAVIVGIVFLLGGTLSGVFDTTNTSIQGGN